LLSLALLFCLLSVSFWIVDALFFYDLVLSGLWILAWEGLLALVGCL
jgi:hypothetical protein